MVVAPDLFRGENSAHPAVRLKVRQTVVSVQRGDHLDLGGKSGLVQLAASEQAIEFPLRCYQLVADDARQLLRRGRRLRLATAKRDR